MTMVYLVQHGEKEPHVAKTHRLLCNLLGDDALPPDLPAAGIPPCAITAVDGLTVVMIASMAYLSRALPR
jgi:hypothetical protein